MSRLPVVMFLSTGRCGTQWITSAVRELHRDVDAEHEPIGPLYKPRLYFRRYDDPAAVLAESRVAAHVERIASAQRLYVETGWPLFAALPLLAARMPERLRVVHLTRDPVPTALSHLAHNSYAGSPRDDAYTRWATLGPGDRNVFQPEYGERWSSLTPYEKCLFWWTEVQLFGLEFTQRFARIPMLRVQAESVLAGERRELARLLEFIGLPWDERWVDRAGTTVDRWHHHTDQEVDPLLVHRHARTVDVAKRLGYDVAALDIDSLQRRYRGTPDPGLDRIGRFAA